jgi:hypothetical protein
MTTHDENPDSDSSTPTHAPARPGEKVGHDGKLYLPVPHPLVQNPEAGSWGEKVNTWWKAFNYFLRGFYGTFVEWGISFMDLALEYPRVAVVGLLFVAVAAEETMNKHPILEGTFKYALYSMDDEAALLIFPPEVDPSEAEEIIDKMAADILTNSAEDYYDSVAYKELELQVRAKMHSEVREALLEMSGITTEPIVVVPAPEATPPVVEAPVSPPVEVPSLEEPVEPE